MGLWQRASAGRANWAIIPEAVLKPDGRTLIPSCIVRDGTQVIDGKPVLRKTHSLSESLSDQMTAEAAPLCDYQPISQTRMNRLTEESQLEFGVRRSKGSVQSQLATDAAFLQQLH